MKHTHPNRIVALATGAKTYDTGEACKCGHLSPRLTANARCVECNRFRAKRWLATDGNYEKSQRRIVAWRCDNHERVLGYSAAFRFRHRDDESVKAYNKRRRRQLPAHRCAWETARRARKLKATPRWANMKAIRRFYEGCPKGHHVDHVVPLKSRYVCGLHVLDNLQYLPATENMRKKNTFVPLSVP